MANFLRRKTEGSRKLLTEADLLAFLGEGRIEFDPLRIADVQSQASVDKGDKAIADALVTFRWGNRTDRTYRFAVEVRRLWTPKAISEATAVARKYAELAGVNPLLLVPYLGEEQLKRLEAEGVSGIDLCGNGVVVIPDELFVLRTGFPNRYRWEGTIKNVYRRNSSVVARTFLLVPEFGSVKEVLQEIRRRGGEVTLATVSKVGKRMVDDLLIEQNRGGPATARPAGLAGAGEFPRPSRVKPSPFLRRLRLIQPEKLLDLLAANYTPPAVSRTFRGKCGLRPDELRERLAKGEGASGAKAVLTGANSVGAYAVMAREQTQSFYCSDINKAVSALGDGVRETDRFADLTLLETRDNFVYFDRREGLVASPIQCYLELLAGDKRERETAEQVRRVILGQPDRQQRRG